MVALLVYTFVFAIRYGVGRDYVDYLTGYQDALNGFFSEHDEIGFSWLKKLLASLDCHPIFFFGLIAFLQIFFVFRSFREDISIFPYLALTFMFGCVWLNFSSAIRQVLAFAFFSYSLTFAEKRKWLQHYILVISAISMHTSAAVLLIIYPFYPLISRFKINSTWISLGILLASVVIGRMPFLEKYLEVVDRILLISGYESYTTTSYQRYVLAEETVRWGIGAFILLAQNVLIIASQKSVRKYFQSRRIDFLFSLYYIGVIGNYLFAASNLFSRLFGYFYWFQFVISAYVLCVAKKTQKKALYYVLLSLYFLTFVAYLYRMFDNSTAYYFYWQSSMFHMPD